MRPGIITWAASLAFVIGGMTLLPMHDDRAAGSINTGTVGKDSSTSVVANLVSYSLTQSIALRQAPKSPRAGHSTLIVKRSTPIHLSIPVIGVSAPLVVLGLNRDGSPQVPSSWYVPGWYKYDSAPGQLGSAVILGHVDSVAGPAVFYRLRELKAGNRVIVKLKDGVTVTYAVLYIREYLKSQFPTKFVYGPHSYPALQLVTCGGTFDHQTGHYLYSIVAFTKLVRR